VRAPTPLRRLSALGAALAVASLPLAPATAGPSQRPPPPTVYVEECGSCHVAYPARFLGRASWGAVLAGLDSHFGADAAVDPQALEGIRAWLEAGARSQETSADGRPLLRISETAWFRHEHPKPSAGVWTHPDVKSPANCGACHRQAEAGDYRERTLRVPKKGEQK
jgi:cytochrome c553